jgi:propanol-preferring alcohol dehydrogenase
VIDGELPLVRASIIPGHEVVGVVETFAADVTGFSIGERLGAAWLASTCGRCRYCLEDAENLCDQAEFNGWTRDGGYAELIAVDARFCFRLGRDWTDEEAAPLLCAGLIGYRAWLKACEPRPVRRLGLYGFGAAAHLLAQLAIAEGQDVFAFTRPGDRSAQDLARGLGCAWAGSSSDAPPVALDAAILFASAGELVPLALQAVRKGGTVVCGGIHMSDVPGFPYRLLWEERRIVSVANLTRADGIDYLARAARAGVRAHVTTYGLRDANRALSDLRSGAISGAAVLMIEDAMRRA